MIDTQRLERQIGFILEIDKLKRVFRRTWLLDKSRLENDAEHSWHLAVMAVLLLEYAEEPGLDLLRVLKMVLVHDLVEIDAGDTYAYDAQGALDQQQREQAAAERIFNLLPPDQAEEIRGIWDEFEARETPEARYAAALDRLQPLLHNYHTQGKAWLEHAVRSGQVFRRNAPAADGSKVLHEYAEGLIRRAVEKGYLAE